MDVSQSNLLLKRAVTIKTVVTPLWKEEVQKQLQTQLNQLDKQVQQLDMQGQRVVSEIQKQNPGMTEDVLNQQITNVQGQINQKKNELLTKKNQALQQLQQVQTLELDQEVAQGQIEGFFRAAVGDNLIKKMQVEILLKDGVVQEIRGEL
ncbi:MAG: hypothetical protein F6K19_17770 [Cyanothece sp. SIO1E1]|nr:hypothetical protein [Cyanothece sp. SIO1E1]